MARHILLIDDEPHVIRIMRLALERAGFTVSQAPNGQAALDLLANAMPDIIISDLDMPVMNGRTFCERVCADFPDAGVRLFVLTSRAELEHRQWARSVPGLEFLEKPVSVRALVRRLEAPDSTVPQDHAGV